MSNRIYSKLDEYRAETSFDAKFNIAVEYCLMMLADITKGDQTKWRKRIKGWDREYKSFWMRASPLGIDDEGWECCLSEHMFREILAQWPDFVGKPELGSVWRQLFINLKWDYSTYHAPIALNNDITLLITI